MQETCSINLMYIHKVHTLLYVRACLRTYVRACKCVSVSVSVSVSVCVSNLFPGARYNILLTLTIED